MIELAFERERWLFTAFAFAVGAVVGSFLNVVIARVPKGESIVHPPSRCPKCGSPIAWYDNVPIFGWLWLRGRCRTCAQPISARYPLVELLVALLAVAIVQRFGPSWTAAGYFAFVAIMVALAYIDLDTWLLPHELSWPLLGLGLLSPLWNRGLPWLDALIGAAAGMGVFAAIALFGEKVLRREVMGWGDVWLLGGIGAWLGWTALLPVVLLSAAQGALVGGVLIAAGKPAGARPEPPPPHDPPETPPRDPTPAPPQEPPPQAAPPASPAGEPKGEDGLDDDWVPPPSAVPYGPFLVLAAVEQLLLGEWLRAQYDRFFRWVFS